MSLINLHRQSQEKWNYRPSCFEAQLSRRAFVEKRLKVVQDIFVSFRFSFFWLQKKKKQKPNKIGILFRRVIDVDVDVVEKKSPNLKDRFLESFLLKTKWSSQAEFLPIEKQLVGCLSRFDFVSSDTFLL